MGKQPDRPENFNAVAFGKLGAQNGGLAIAMILMFWTIPSLAASQDIPWSTMMELFLEKHHMDGGPKDSKTVWDMFSDPDAMKTKEVLIFGTVLQAEKMEVLGEKRDVYLLGMNVPFTMPTQRGHVVFWPAKPIITRSFRCVGRIMGSVPVRLVPSGIVKSIPLVFEKECLDRPEVLEKIKQKALQLQSSKQP